MLSHVGTVTSSHQSRTRSQTSESSLAGASISWPRQPVPFLAATWASLAYATLWTSTRLACSFSPVQTQIGLSRMSTTFELLSRPRGTALADADRLARDCRDVGRELQRFGQCRSRGP